jgi:hypothetical protein
VHALLELESLGIAAVAVPISARQNENLRTQTDAMKSGYKIHKQAMSGGGTMNEANKRMYVCVEVATVTIDDM